MRCAIKYDIDVQFSRLISFNGMGIDCHNYQRAINCGITFSILKWF